MKLVRPVCTMLTKALVFLTFNAPCDDALEYKENIDKIICRSRYQE